VARSAGVVLTKEIILLNNTTPAEASILLRPNGLALRGLGFPLLN
jgi:hypothetical protein